MFKISLNKLFIPILIITTTMACQQKVEKEIIFPHTDLTQTNTIPKPLEVTATHSAFSLNKNTVIHTSKDGSDFENIGKFLSKRIKEKIDLDIAVNIEQTKISGNNIYIHQLKGKESTENKEAYQLYISKDSVVLSASTAEGAFRGVQTLRQLIPIQSNDTLAAYKMWLISTGQITDRPNFEYRGFMLDVARHFFSVEEVKKQIDILAYYKINVLHLHLSDDQGWRIEIKSWPKLTEVGSISEVGGGKGGFYTQEDYKELVAYAAERYITIIPEIDMPGHTNAASVSYPELNGNGKRLKQYSGTKVGFSTFDANKEEVYKFIDDVVKEISAISPGSYFHIGGDESHVTKKKDYILFVNKVEKIVQKHGKQMIGWDEIIQASIDSTTIAQHWSNQENAIKAAKNGLKVILSPAKKAYLDMQYDKRSKYGLHWAAYIPVDTAYQWIPETHIKGIPKESILGIEAPLWSETISNNDELEYLAYPRVIGYAELGWSTKENLNWEDYKKRLASQQQFLDRMNIKYYPTKLIDWKNNK
jgi:hexosaminidase